MSQDDNTVNHLVQLNLKVGELTAKVGGLSDELVAVKSKLESVEESLSKIKSHSQALTGGIRTAAFIVGMLGGAAGGKIAHFLGFFNSAGPHN